MANPVEIKGGVSAISAADRAVVVKPPFSLHLDRVPMLGDKHIKRIVSASGSWFVGHTPVGDFSGTDTGGDGGPADLACPHGPTGTDTIIAAGVIDSNTGASTSTFIVNTELNSISDDGIDTVVDTISAVAWTSSGNTLTKTGAFANYSFQAGDLAFITGGTGVVRGYVSVSSRTSADVIVLATSIKSGTAANVTVKIQRAPYWTYNAAVMKRFGTPISVSSSTAWTAATQTVTKTGGFSTYTFTGDDWVRVTAGTGAKVGWYRVKSRTDNDNIVLTGDSTVLSDVDIASDLALTIYPSYNAIGCESAAWTSSTKTLTLSGAFSSYTPGTDDTVWFRSTDGSDYSTQYFVKVSSKTSSDAIVLAEDPIGADAATVHCTVLKRGSFEQVDLLATSPWYGSASGAVNSLVKLDGTLTFTPAIGDLYYVWPYESSDEANHGITSTVENDIEGIPVTRDSSTVTTWTAWPYFTPNRCALASYQGYAQRANYNSAAQGTDICTSWHGNFITPAGTFCYGDEVEIKFGGDIQSGGQPFFVEILMIPNFDPDADWDISGTTDNASRLPDKAVVLYSPTLTTDELPLGAVHLIEFVIKGKAMGLSTTGGENWTQGWSCDLRFGLNSSLTTQAPILIGPYSRSISAADIDFLNEDVRWTFLLKVEHPSLRGNSGYHGYYPGEPFSATTGNGGSLLVPVGYTTSTALPHSPRMRPTYFTVDWKPSGSF